MTATILTLLVTAVLYVGACVVKPYTACIGCTGRLYQATPVGCTRCGGMGVRLRFGVQLVGRAYEAFTRRRRAAAGR